MRDNIVSRENFKHSFVILIFACGNASHCPYPHTTFAFWSSSPLSLVCFHLILIFFLRHKFLFSMNFFFVFTSFDRSFVCPSLFHYNTFLVLLYIFYTIQATEREREKKSEHNDVRVALSLHPHFIGILLKSDNHWFLYCYDNNKDRFLTQVHACIYDHLPIRFG